MDVNEGSSKDGDRSGSGDISGDGNGNENLEGGREGREFSKSPH